MYFKYNTLDEVITELEKRRKEAEAKRNAWAMVRINKKKNGDEFARIGQAVDGAKVGGYYPVEDSTHPYLSICTRANGCGYVSDEMPIYWYLDEMPKDDPRRAEYVPQFIRQTTPKTPDEIRAALTERVAMYTERVKSYDEQIKNAPEVFRAYRDAIAKANKELETASGKTGIYNTFLYYLVSECH